MPIPATIYVPNTDDEAVAAVIVEECIKTSANVKRNKSLTKRLKNLVKRGTGVDKPLDQWLKSVEEPSATYEADNSELSLNHDDDNTVESFLGLIELHKSAGTQRRTKPSKSLF